VSRFQFVADHRPAFEVKRLCEVVEVNRPSFYAWDADASVRAQRAAQDAELAERMRVAHQADKAYGAHPGSPPSSTTAPHPNSASTTSGSRG
jgi:hypothetical protein